jgi:hypothetical protein
VQHFDQATPTARILVLDPVTLATNKTITLKRALGTVCVSPDGSQAFATDPDIAGGSVFMLDVAGGAITRTLAVPAGTWAAVLSPDANRLVVACPDTLTVIDTASFTVLGTVTVPTSANLLAMTRDGREVILGSSKAVYDPKSVNALAVIDVETRKITASFALGFWPSLPVITPDGAQMFLAGTALGGSPQSPLYALKRQPSGGQR